MLKRLELQGFKSFADKTALEFPAAITAVVGPNGSGKSNVVDAIRWVLGEQSLKNLRSAKSEDVIFAGTPKRQASSFAAVSLHFSNEGKLFPLDYGEVSLGRKLYRDGASEYLLNRASTRLKDTVQLLASARLGVRGLLVINQGSGDIFLRASSDERREMLEEVIGLKEFRMKKEDAQRKLEETALNIEKVGALVAEIEPHLRSLKRQASRWEKRREKETLLKTLEEAYFRVKLGEVERFGEDFLKEKQKVEREMEALSGEIKKLEADFSERQEILSKAGERAREFDEALKSLGAQRAGILREIGKIEGRIEAESERGAEEGAIRREELLEKLSEVRGRLRDAVALADFEELKALVSKVLKDLDQFFAEPSRPGTRPSFAAEKERLLRSLESLETETREVEAAKEKRAEEDEATVSQAREALRELEAKREAFREKEVVAREYRFEEEKRLLHENELRLRMKESGWDFDAFKAGWQGKEAPSFPIEGLESAEDLEVKILRLRRELADIGAVDEEILREYQDTEKRFQFLSGQKADLESAERDLVKLAGDLEEKISRDFGKALRDVSAEFQHYFRVIFGGGNARLKEEKGGRGAEREIEGEEGEGGEEEKNNEPGAGAAKQAGVEISVDLPRKKIKGIDMLSGGERALTSIALIFAIVGTSRPPFLVLDEIDAPLDEANSRRFAKLLKELAAKTQFILITHNRATMEAADVLYGVAIEDGVSKLFSLKFEEAEKVAAQDVHD